MPWPYLQYCELSQGHLCAQFWAVCFDHIWLERERAFMGNINLYLRQGRKWSIQNSFFFKEKNLSKISMMRLPLGGSDGKGSACSAGDLGLIPVYWRSPGEGNSNPLQYSCLENSMDRGVWRDTVHGVAKSWMQLTLSLSPGKPPILPELDFLYVLLMPSLLILAFIPSS